LFLLSVFAPQSDTIANSKLFPAEHRFIQFFSIRLFPSLCCFLFLPFLFSSFLQSFPLLTPFSWLLSRPPRWLTSPHHGRSHSFGRHGCFFLSLRRLCRFSAGSVCLTHLRSTVFVLLCHHAVIFDDSALSSPLSFTFFLRENPLPYRGQPVNSSHFSKFSFLASLPSCLDQGAGSAFPCRTL